MLPVSEFRKQRGSMDFRLCPLPMARPANYVSWIREWANDQNAKQYEYIPFMRWLFTGHTMRFEDSGRLDQSMGCESDSVERADPTRARSWQNEKYEIRS